MYNKLSAINTDVNIIFRFYHYHVFTLCNVFFYLLNVFRAGFKGAQRARPQASHQQRTSHQTVHISFLASDRYAYET